MKTLTIFIISFLFQFLIISVFEVALFDYLWWIVTIIFSIVLSVLVTLAWAD